MRILLVCVYLCSSVISFYDTIISVRPSQLRGGLKDESHDPEAGEDVVLLAGNNEALVRWQKEKQIRTEAQRRRRCVGLVLGVNVAVLVLIRCVCF